MKNNLGTLALVGSIMAMAGLTMPVHAGISETENNGLTWLGTPTYLVAAGATAASFTTSENNWGATGGAGGNGGLSQSFTLSSSGVLSTIQLVLGGTTSAGSPNTFDVFLVDLGAYPGSGYPATSASYNQPGLGSILSSGLQFSYAGTAGTAANVVQLTFSGADAVTLNAGELYAFELDPTLSPSGGQTVWYRANLGGPGQMYRENQFSTGNMGALNGSTRDAAFALTVVPAPEPASMALLGLSALVGTFMVRRHNK